MSLLQLIQGILTQFLDRLWFWGFLQNVLDLLDLLGIGLVIVILFRARRDGIFLRYFGFVLIFLIFFGPDIAIWGIFRVRIPSGSPSGRLFRILIWVPGLIFLRRFGVIVVPAWEFIDIFVDQILRPRFQVSRLGRFLRILMVVGLVCEESMGGVVRPMVRYFLWRILILPTLI